VTQSRLGRALYDLQKTTSAPWISVVILEKPDGAVQAYTQRIFEQCCAGSASAQTGAATDVEARRDSGHVLLVVYAGADSVGIAADERGYDALPRATLERIVRQEMMIDGRYIRSRESVHAGLTALVAELGAGEEMLARVSAEGPPSPRAEIVEESLVLQLFLVLVLLIPGLVITGVATVMEGGGLRSFLYLVSWGLIAAWTGVASVGVHELVGEPMGDEGDAFLLVLGGLVLGTIVFLLIRVGVGRRLDTLSAEDYETWTYTLKGGAAVGASAGAVGNLVRSAAAKGSGYGGFGGGSFGGGGAGGSFQAAGGAAGSSAAGAGTAGAGTAGAGTTGAGTAGAAQAAAASSASVSGGGIGAGSTLGGLLGKVRWRALLDRLRAFRWYHYLSFAVVALVFYRVAIYTLWVLEFDPLFWVVAGGCTLYAGFRLWDRWGPDVQQRLDGDDDSSFRGRSSSASW
jgi:hypothetical protein